MRGVASSSTHCGRKPSWQVPSEKTMSLCVLCSSAAVAFAVGQLQLQLSHQSLVVLQAFCFPKCDFWGGLEGASIKKFSRLAIARHIFRPPHKLCCNSTTASGVVQQTSSTSVLYAIHFLSYHVRIRFRCRPIVWAYSISCVCMIEPCY